MSISLKMGISGMSSLFRLGVGGGGDGGQDTSVSSPTLQPDECQSPLMENVTKETEREH